MYNVLDDMKYTRIGLGSSDLKRLSASSLLLHYFWELLN